MDNKCTRKTYDISKKLQREDYQLLLDYALEWCTKCSFVTRFDLGSSENMQLFISKMENYLLSKYETDIWPGTHILVYALIRVYSYEQKVVTVLKHVSNLIYDWQQPDIPEDMCIYRSDGSVWLGSIAHEKVAWLNLSKTELDLLHDSSPRLFGLLAKRGTKGTDICLSDDNKIMLCN